MKNLNLTFLLLFFGTMVFGQELEDSQIYLADPTIFEDNGTYYLYGTKGDPRIEGEGFLVYTSKNLKDWEGPAGVDRGFALSKGKAFGTKGFWAPQVFKYKGKYYMAYTADEQIAIATSNSPLGPFTTQGNALEASTRQIDPFIFFDQGKAYLYHVRLQDGNRIFVAEMDDDLQSIKPETLQECISAQTGWEDTKNVNWKVAEGPTVVKKHGIYYLLYSANDFRNPDYAVGYATSTNPLGPWKKSENSPVISRKNTGKYGSGHGDLINDKNGELYYVFHTHFSEYEVRPRKTALVKLTIEPSSIPLEQKSFRWLRVQM